VKAAENRFFKTPPKPCPCEEIPQKKLKKRNPQESWHERVFGVQKTDSRKQE
jgi:hypothetical protein